MKPIQFLTVSIVCLLSFGFFRTSLSGAEIPLFVDQDVERFGLTRTWFNQVQIDPMRHEVLYAIQEGGTLFLVSDDAKLHAIDAVTGKSLWMRTFGEKGMSYAEPAANSRLVAVHNGMELYIFNRKNGKQLFQARLPGAAATACELSENYVFVPMMDGKIIAFPLEDHQPVFDDDAAPAKPAATAEDDEVKPAEPIAAAKGEDPVLAKIVKSFETTKQSVMAEPEVPKPEPPIVLRGPLGIPMVCQSFGNVLAKPLISTQLISYAPNGRPLTHQEILTWVTDHGSLFAGGINAFSQEKFELRYMIDSTAEAFFLDKTRIAQREWNKGNEIVVRPTPNQCEPSIYFENKSKELVIPNLVVVGSRGGYVFSVRDRLGEVFWQFAANGPVVEQIAVVGKDVYCPTFPAGMHALNLIDGKEKWFAPAVKKFVAASKKRLYVLDAHNNMILLDRETGTPISSFNVRQIDQCLFNIETDLIFFVNKSGLVQCLKERRICGNPECRDNPNCPHAEDLAKPIQHRLSAAQYAEAMKQYSKDQSSPKLYWMTDANADAETPEAAQDEESKETDDENPFGDTTKKKSGEDGGLDADEDAKPKTAPKPAAAPKADDDPFN